MKSFLKIKKMSFSPLKLFLMMGILCLGAFFGCMRNHTETQDSAQENHSILSSETAQTDEMLRLASRAYIASTLKEIFGPTATPIISALIEKNILAMGGEACQPYKNDCEDGEDAAGWSPYGDSGLPIIPRATTLRAALMYRACDRIAAQDDAIRFAASLVLGNAPLRQPLEADILSAFDEFRPGRVLDEESAAQLLAVSLEAGKMSALEAWRFLFLTLCLEPGWQLP